MKMTKSQLKQIIKEELAASLLAEAEGQKYCCLEGQPFKIHDAGSKVLLLSCSETSCQMLGKMPKEQFQAKLKSGEFKVV